jgi:hypothetical protein
MIKSVKTIQEKEAIIAEYLFIALKPAPLAVVMFKGFAVIFDYVKIP